WNASVLQVVPDAIPLKLLARARTQTGLRFDPLAKLLRFHASLWLHQHVRELAALATDEVYCLAVARVHDREAQERRWRIGDSDDGNFMIVEFERAPEFERFARIKQHVARLIYYY